LLYAWNSCVPDGDTHVWVLGVAPGQLTCVCINVCMLVRMLV